jgi:hypothetical protein
METNMSNIEKAYLVLVIGACIIFVVTIGWVDWSSGRRPARNKEQAQSGTGADADSDLRTYRPFIRL